MNNNLFNIEDSERQRILEMHQSATNRQYLVEQVATQQPITTTTTTATQKVTNSTIGGVQIPGFLFAEDDIDWITATNKETGGKINGEMFSYENGVRVAKYYGVENTSYKDNIDIDPNILIGKYVIMFNAKSNYYSFQKENVAQTTFKIGLVYRSTQSHLIFLTAGSASGTGLNIRIPQTSGTAAADDFYLYNGDASKGEKYTNNVFPDLSISKFKTYKELTQKPD